MENRVVNLAIAVVDSGYFVETQFKHESVWSQVSS